MDARRHRSVQNTNVAVPMNVLVLLSRFLLATVGTQRRLSDSRLLAPILVS